jgi:hypothetical protein
VVGEETKAKTGITPQLLRLSVGLEAADDLWEDLSAALGAAVTWPQSAQRSPKRISSRRAALQALCVSSPSSG